MASTGEFVLVIGIFIILFVSLILFIVYGSQAFQQFNLITDQLNATFNSAIEGLLSITDSLIVSISSFGRTAVNTFDTITKQLGTTFLSVSSFLKDNLASMITTTGGNIIAITQSTVTGITNGLYNMTNAGLQLYNTVYLVYLQVYSIYTYVETTIIVLILSVVTFVLSFIAELIANIIVKSMETYEIVLTFINESIQVLSNIWVSARNSVCKTPLICNIFACCS